MLRQHKHIIMLLLTSRDASVNQLVIGVRFALGGMHREPHMSSMILKIVYY